MTSANHKIVGHTIVRCKKPVGKDDGGFGSGAGGGDSGQGVRVKPAHRGSCSGQGTHVKPTYPTFISFLRCGTSPSSKAAGVILLDPI